MRDYRRAGLGLNKADRDEVERLRKQLSDMCTDFDTHVVEAETKLDFTKDELAGAPDDFLEGVKNSNGTYTIKANVTWHYITVEENAKSEATRLKVETARDQLAMARNVPLLQKILVTRDQIAHLLGYKTWA